MTKKVSIIILNYCSSKDTIECLKSLEQITYLNKNIIIVDNASTDESVEKIGEYLDGILDKKILYVEDIKKKNSVDYDIFMIKSDKNGGYGYGNNIGIQYAINNGADYLLVLNNDTVVSKSFIEPLVKAYNENEKIGLLTGKIFYYDFPNRLWFNGGYFDKCTAKVKHLDMGLSNLTRENNVNNTFISGCMWFLSVHVLEEVGYINEDYFMYIEDLEYSQRLLEKGYKLGVCDDSIIWHKVGKSTGGGFSEFSVFWRSRNMNLFLRQHVKNIFCKLSAIVIYNVTSVLRLIKYNRLDLIKTYLKALRR